MSGIVGFYPPPSHMIGGFINQSIVSLNYTIGILSYSKIEQNLKNFLFCYLFLSINKILILSFPCQNNNVSFSGLFRNSSRVSSYFIVIVVGVVCFIGEMSQSEMLLLLLLMVSWLLMLLLMLYKN